MKKIVVGVDGSDGAAEALRWALDLAVLNGAQVEAVQAWDLSYGWIDGYAPDVQRWCGERSRAAARSLDAAVDGVVQELQPTVEVKRLVLEGPPARVLIDEAKDADLLVVGSRGRGGFVGLLLGSVSQQCVQHSHCPVVVIPAHG